MTVTREQEYITEARQLARQLWHGINGLKNLQAEWNAKDYTNTLNDGRGINDGITKTEVGGAVFDTANALLTTLAAGHATNLAKLL